MSNNSSDKNLENVKKVYSFWGRFPSLYSAQDIITFLGRAKTIRSRAVKKMGLKRGDRALEVACGSGRNFPYLVEAVGKDGFILGFDYSQEMLDAAKQLSKRNGWHNIRFIQGDAAQLKIKEDDFDGILSVLGISAIPNWKKALNRCYDVLRPGGKLVICDAHLFTGFLKILNPLVKIIYSKFAAWDPSKNIPEKMKEIFGNVEVENFNLGTFFIATSIKKRSKYEKNNPKHYFK
jgi:demethylmenaquinone methyltransferase/2-methoxy-6-polyprenyl-1,4-benzoquinol methylase